MQNSNSNLRFRSWLNYSMRTSMDFISMPVLLLGVGILELTFGNDKGLLVIGLSPISFVLTLIVMLVFSRSRFYD